MAKLKKTIADEKQARTPYIVADLLGFGMEGMKAKTHSKR